MPKKNQFLPFVGAGQILTLGFRSFFPELDRLYLLVEISKAINRLFMLKYLI